MNICCIARRVGLLVALFVAGSVLAAAPAKPKATAPKGESIVLRGDYASARVFEALAKAFQKSGQGRVEIQPFSTISGLDAVYAGTADVAGAARPAMPGRVEEQGTTFYPVAWDALVPIVAASNPVSNVTLKQLHDVYLGRLTNWKDMGGADASINLDGAAAPLDGIEYSTRLLLFHYGDQNVSVSRMYVNTEKLEEDIALNAHGLGMSVLSSVLNDAKVKMLSVEGVHASTATIADGTYPLYAAIYLASRDDDAQHAQVLKFMAYAGSDAGRAILRTLGLVPYADAPDLPGKQEERVAFIDALVRPAAQAAVVASKPTPVSAPNATASSLRARAPTSELTREAVERAERARAEKVQKSTNNRTDKDDGGN